MADDYDRDDRQRRDDRDERRPRRSRRRYEDEREGRTYPKEVSVLGVVALVKGIIALILSVIPCFGAFAIFAGGLALLLAIASILVAKHSRHGMGFPVAATVVSSTAVAISLVWVAMFGAMMRGTEERVASRPAPAPAPAPLPPPPPFVQTPPRVQPPVKAPPKKTPEEEKADEDKFQKQLLEDLAKDRIKEAIRNGPGLKVTAEKLERDYLTNIVAAESKYKDHVLEVSGTVVRVIRDKGQTTYTLELETGEPTKTINCDFAEKQKYPLASVERGQQVKVRGLCLGHVNEFVQLKDCVLVK